MYTQFFSPEAAVRWTALPADFRESITCASWCKRCGRPVPLGNVEGLIRRGDLLIRARCAFCSTRINTVIPVTGPPPN